MDPGEVPSWLPILTQMEEMLIARVHVHLLVKRFRGHQYQYSGHCVSFMQNEANIIDELPTLPQDANILILRPANKTEEEQSRQKRRFQRDFKVRRNAVKKWLRFLKNNHPDYRCITICR
jgi:hypothetical protein